MKDEYYKILYELVLESNKLNEIPVGSIVIYDNKIIGKGYNNRQTTKDVCGHAEINAIKEAEQKLGDWRLNDCILISTLHPCKMCQQVIKESRIDKVYYFISQEEVLNKSYQQIKSNKQYLDNINNIFLEFFKSIR